MGNKAFHKFEFDFWNVTAAPYDSAIGPATSQSVEHLLRVLNISAGGSLLDVACGPGYVTASASKKQLHVTGVDFSAAMIRMAQERHPGSEFKIADAGDLPFPDNFFDGVSCNFGILHFPDPEKAMDEACRVAKPGAPYAFVVWNTLDKSPVMSFMMDAVQKHAATEVKLPEGPPFFHYSIAENSFPAMKKAGFEDLEREEIGVTWMMDSAESFVRGFYEGGARIGEVLRGQSQKSIADIVSYIDEKIAPYKASQAYAVPGSIVITSGRKPK